MVEIYVDDIFFESTSILYVKRFVHIMFNEFKMSIVDELTSFLV